MLQPGKALKQRPQYVIETEIGAGGFGVKLMCSTHCIIKKPEVTVAQASCLY
ncbi:hypothetical protein H6F32_13325 [Anabaena sp. FACHB-1237]|uniref:hypothetical protein n=1 Tax=Anabaena sp. FACHB-1237 TaxID=2692769 RepID=UPI001681AEB8|nr:hypothetical protein [Anabaena sp. FACHB-1237]MBD2138546.1 hypothetical protein [Anabaena sp. FACHB-1237]